MKRALLVAYEYPPIGGIGQVRPVKFSKYLAAFGWEPHVLTVTNPDRFYTTVADEPAPAGVAVHRAVNPFNNLSILEGGLRRLGVNAKVLVPDVFLGWVGSAVRAGLGIIAREGIELIYITAPPFSACRIGVLLKQETGLPLALDFRDAWTLGPNPVTYTHPGLKERDERLEEEAFLSADRIVTATVGIAEQYAAKYPFAAAKLVPILNGFDCDDIPHDEKPFPTFTIAYTGFFYGAQSPALLIRGLARILKEALIPADEIQFLWAGRDAPWVHSMMREAGVDRITRYLGLVPKAKADELLYRSHLLFFLLGETDRVSQRRTLTGKIFPYLASGRPILAIVPEGDAQKLIREYSDNSYIITDGDVDKVVKAILDAYAVWRSGSAVVTAGPRTREFRRRYNYRERTRELAAVFDSLTESLPASDISRDR